MSRSSLGKDRGETRWIGEKSSHGAVVIVIVIFIFIVVVLSAIAIREGCFVFAGTRRPPRRR